MSTIAPVVLVILDGFGINPRKEGNAIANASMPNFNAFLRSYPAASLSMSGVDVGLPAGQMGNSEVGHMILGAGRVVYQDLTLIHKDIEDGKFYSNSVLLDALRKTKAARGRLHLMGLLGDGGVHSHQRHMEALLEMAKREKVGAVSLTMLTKTLRQLERGGLVKRTVYPPVPPRVDYRLTRLGDTSLKTRLWFWKSRSVIRANTSWSLPVKVRP